MNYNQKLRILSSLGLDMQLKKCELQWQIKQKDDIIRMNYKQI